MSKIIHFIVNYKNNEQTINFIKNFAQLKGSNDVNLVVINNSAKDLNDTSFDPYARLNNQISVFNYPDNPGYFNAADRASSQFNVLDYDYTILSNTDIEFVSQDFYETLSELKMDKDVGAIAPSIKSDLSKKESNPLYHERPKKEKIERLAWVYSSFIIAWVYHFISWLKNRYVGGKQDLPDGAAIYALHGSFIILRKNFFHHGGSFKYPAKLYGEEIFLAEALRKMNLRTVFVKRLRLSHKEKGTEDSWIGRYALSYRTFLFKKESSSYINSLFN